MKSPDSIQDNTTPAEKFEPPLKCEAYMEGKMTGSCFVYDAASWRNQEQAEL